MIGGRKYSMALATVLTGVFLFLFTTAKTPSQTSAYACVTSLTQNAVSSLALELGNDGVLTVFLDVRRGMYESYIHGMILNVRVVAICVYAGGIPSTASRNGRRHLFCIQSCHWLDGPNKCVNIYSVWSSLRRGDL